MQNERALDLSTEIDGHTREDDYDADTIDSAGNLCDDCLEEDTGYCRCLVWDWGKKGNKRQRTMTKRQVFALFKQEKAQERAVRAQRQTTRKARVNLTKFKNSVRLSVRLRAIVEHWKQVAYSPGSKLVKKMAAQFKIDGQRLMSTGDVGVVVV